MVNNSMGYLEALFKRAIEVEAEYVAVKIEMNGFPSPEIIINPIENAESKLKYYQNIYDENLNHKHAKGIRIIEFTYGYSFEEIENELIWRKG